MLNVTYKPFMLNVTYGECRYSEYRGALKETTQKCTENRSCKLPLRCLLSQFVDTPVG